MLKSLSGMEPAERSGRSAKGFRIHFASSYSTSCLVLKIAGTDQHADIPFGFLLFEARALSHSYLVFDCRADYGVESQHPQSGLLPRPNCVNALLGRM